MQVCTALFASQIGAAHRRAAELAELLGDDLDATPLTAILLDGPTPVHPGRDRPDQDGRAHDRRAHDSTSVLRVVDAAALGVSPALVTLARLAHGSCEARLAVGVIGGAALLGRGPTAPIDAARGPLVVIDVTATVPVELRAAARLAVNATVRVISSDAPWRPRGASADGTGAPRPSSPIGEPIERVPIVVAVAPAMVARLAAAARSLHLPALRSTGPSDLLIGASVTADVGHDACDPELPGPARHPVVAGLLIEHLAAHLRLGDLRVGTARTHTDGTRAATPSSDGPVTVAAAITRRPHDVAAGGPDRWPADAGGVGTPVPPPIPGRGDPGAVGRWLRQPVTASPWPVSRVLAAVHRARTDLHETYPDLAIPEHRRGLLHWAATFGPHDPDLPPGCIPPDPGPDPRASVGSPRRHADPAGPSPDRTTGDRPDVLVAGYLSSTLGLGEAGRLLAERLRGTGATVSTYDYRHVVGGTIPWTDRPDRIDPTSVCDRDVVPEIVVLAVNGAETARLVGTLGERIGSAWRVGLWFWEGSVFPDVQAEGLAHVDEVWVTSMVTAEAVTAAAHRGGLRTPVHVVPLGCSAVLPRADDPIVRAGHRARLGLPAGTLVGFSFDLRSTLVRKNPEGLIDAWTLAFPTADQRGRRTLVLKTQHGAVHPKAMASLTNRCAERADIVVWDRDLSTDDQRRFMASLDAYASLHRGEGYGLLLLEAMALGLPVIATGAGGNLAFMTDDNAWLVPADEVTLDHAVESYPAGTAWFEPDVAAAAHALRTVVGGGPDVDARARRGRDTVAGLADGTAAVDWITRRLAALRAARTGR